FGCKIGLVLRNDFRQHFGEVPGGYARCEPVCAGNRSSERVGERLVDLAGVGESVKSLALVKAAHLDRPFDRITLAAHGKTAVWLAGDGRDSAIDRRRERAIDRNFGFAGGLAFCEGGKIEK